MIKREELEIQRHNVTVSQFLAYVRSQIKKHGLEAVDPSEIDIDYFKSGNDLNFDYHDIPGKPCKAEKSVSKPYQMQTYIRNWDGTVYNFIMEFDFYDEKTGNGYFYFLNTWKEEEKTETREEENQEEENQEETHNENKKGRFTMYNYYDAVKADVLDYIQDEINLADYDDLDDLAEKLNDDLWIDDSVTGNASGSYTFNSYTAKEYVFDNMDLVEEMASEFCIDYAEIGRRFINEDWEWFDVSIRCYVLGACISDALEEIREEWEEAHNSDDDENDD